jgi:hypothetical protein
MLNRPVRVAITNTSGISGVAHWINAYYGLRDDKALDRKNPVVVKIKEWVDSEYDRGRVTAITDEELERLTDDFCKE